MNTNNKLPFFVVVILLISFTNLNSQTDTSKSNNYTHKSLKPKKEIKLTDEDTIIRTPTQVIIVKKKDYYSGKYIQKDIKINPGDSVITTPDYNINGLSEKTHLKKKQEINFSIEIL